MDIREIIRMRQKVEVIRQEENSNKRYKSSIQEIKKNEFAIQAPYDRGVEINLVPGEKVEIELIRENERFVFPAVVLRRETKNIPLLFFAIPSKDRIKRIQLRNHVRVPFVEDIEYCSLEELKRKNTETFLRRGVSIDISGGGMKFIAREKHKIGEFLRIEFMLPDEECKMSLKARVVRVEPGAYENEFVTAVAWEKISRTEEDKIVRMVFLRQLQARKAKKHGKTETLGGV